MRILVLGATGMLGHAVFRVFSADAGHETWGSMRSAAGLRHFPAAAHARLLSGVDVLDQDALLAVMARVKPEVVINCVGLIKQLADAGDPLTALPINAMLPHRLARLCALAQEPDDERARQWLRAWMWQYASIRPAGPLAFNHVLDLRFVGAD